MQQLQWDHKYTILNTQDAQCIMHGNAQWTDTFSSTCSMIPWVETTLQNAAIRHCELCKQKVCSISEGDSC